MGTKPARPPFPNTHINLSFLRPNREAIYKCWPAYQNINIQEIGCQDGYQEIWVRNNRRLFIRVGYQEIWVRNNHQLCIRVGYQEICIRNNRQLCIRVGYQIAGR
jgi:hypothetical protein